MLNEKQQKEIKPFIFAHLPDDLAKVSKPFYDLAYDMLRTLPDNEEKKFFLRKLIEAKDCAVRSALFRW